MRNEKGQFIKGQRASPATEFKKGQHWRMPKPYWDRAWLEREYTTLGKSAADIAGEQGCQPNNILYFLHKHGIPRRTMAEARAIKYWGLSGASNGMYGRCGAESPNWKGGVTPERQAFYSSLEWQEIARQVCERDAWTCQRCNEKGEHIHHIVSFAVRELRLDLDNLVLLCAGCHHFIHSKRNTKREFIRGGDD